MRSVSTHKGDTVHYVWFRVHYESKFGEEVCVFGSIPELGGWKEHKYMLKWTEGHIWVSDKPLVTKARHFFYKYRVIMEKELTEWESGIDRICQPELLPEGTHGRSVDKSLIGGRNVQINDEWEQYNVNF